MTTRIATVGYLNARPLTDHLDRETFEVVQGHPSDIARLLRDGEVDLALVPVAAALSDGDFRVVPEVCIGAEGEVHSVVLAAETEPEQWTEVVLDGVSRTSRTLARLLLTRGPLAERVRDDLVIREGGKMEGLDKAGGTVAGLVIGDAARELPERLGVRLDLAKLWHDWHGLPFVFAVWAGRPELDGAIVDAVRAAGRTGLARRTEEHSGADLEYVTRYIRYDLDDRALTGLRRYAALAHRDGLVGTEDVQLFGPTHRRVTRRDLDAELTRAADGETLDAEAIRALALEARTADLTAAASLRRDALLGRLEAVPWTPARRIVVTDVDVDGHGVWKAPGESDGIVRTPDDVAVMVEEAAEVDAGAILLVGGHHPGLGTDAWCRFVEAAVGASDAPVHALSLEGLRHLSAVDDIPVEAVVERLRDAGLTGLAEESILALDDVVRADERWLSPRMWLGLAEVVHRGGLAMVAGLEVGAGESIEARLEHLAVLDALQARTHGFTAFRARPLTAERGVRPDGATAEDHIRTVALARIALRHVDHHAATWLAGAPGLAQTALHAGADMLGHVLLGEREAEEDARYVNPRARLGKRREVDPWKDLVGDVKHALKKAGFAADRRAAEPRITPAPSGAPSARA